MTISDSQFYRKNTKIIWDILIDNSFPNDLICKLIRRNNISRRFKNNINNIANNINNSVNINSSANNNNEENNNNNINGRNINNIENNNNLDPKIYKSLVYVPGLSERLERSDIYDNSRYRMAHRICNNVGKLFSRTKDRISTFDRSNLVYKIPCIGNSNERCDKIYVGTTKNKLKTRIAGHKSNLKNINYNSTGRTALTIHCRELGHKPDFEGTSILDTEVNYRRRLMLEMLRINDVPYDKRINFKADTDGLAKSYRHLLFMNNNRNYNRS